MLSHLGGATCSAIFNITINLSNSNDLSSPLAKGFILRQDQSMRFRILCRGTGTWQEEGFTSTVEN